MDALNIRVPAFEGPMDLLMHLIDKNKIDIYDIPIASLTEQYLEYLHQLKEFNLEIASEFLVMAATLLSIKTRMMLPKSEKPEETADEENDPRQELVRRIIEYRRFLKVSEVLSDMAISQGRYVARSPMEIPVRHQVPDSIPLSALLSAFQMVIEVKEELRIPDALVAPEEYNIEDKMKDLLNVLHLQKGKMKFTEAFKSGTRTELIVTFLAMLELIKQQEIRVEQGHAFGEIFIKETAKDEREEEWNQQ